MIPSLLFLGGEEIEWQLRLLLISSVNTKPKPHHKSSIIYRSVWWGMELAIVEDDFLSMNESFFFPSVRKCRMSESFFSHSFFILSFVRQWLNRSPDFQSLETFKFSNLSKFPSFQSFQTYKVSNNTGVNRISSCHLLGKKLSKFPNFQSFQFNLSKFPNSKSFQVSKLSKSSTTQGWVGYCPFI